MGKMEMDGRGQRQKPPWQREAHASRRIELKSAQSARRHHSRSVMIKEPVRFSRRLGASGPLGFMKGREYLGSPGKYLSAGTHEGNTWEVPAKQMCSLSLNAWKVHVASVLLPEASSPAAKSPRGSCHCSPFSQALTAAW